MILLWSEIPVSSEILLSRSNLIFSIVIYLQVTYASREKDSFRSKSVIRLRSKVSCE